jgi:hypothetical protein
MKSVYSINKKGLLGALLLSIIALPAVAQNWYSYVDTEELFVINMPGEPEVTEFIYATEWGGNLPAKLYSIDIGGVDYRLTVVNYGTDETAYVQLEDHTDDDFPWLYDLRGSMAYAAHNIRKGGGEITFDAWHHIEMVEGHQIQITHEDGSRTYAATYLYEEEGRLYIIEALGPANGLYQGIFQQSLHFLDQDGQRVRYILHPDGSEEKRTDLGDQYE